MPSLAWPLLIGITHLLTGHHIATGEITGIRLLSNTDQSYQGKVEVRYRHCNGDWCSSSDWYAICHDGSDDNDHNNWDRAASTTACKQLGFEAGWDGSKQGITKEFTFENFVCSDTATSLDDCSYEPYELLGCGLSTLKLDHWEQDQAYVECYNLADTSVSLVPYSDTTGISFTQGLLNVIYRNYWYDVCFSGGDDGDQDWSLDEANAVCHQLGYPLGAAQTTRSNSTLTNQRSFDDFRCKEDTQHLFSCFPDPPNNSGCGENNRVFIKCTGLVQDGTTTDIDDKLMTERDSTAGTTTLMYTNDNVHAPKPEDTTAASNKSDLVDGTPNDAENQIDGIIIGIPVGVAVIITIVIVVCVICFVHYRRRGKTTAQSEPQITTTVHSNETFHNENEYDVQNGGTEYAYAYADYDRGGGNVSAQEQTNSIAENHRGPSVSDGWADNVAYVSHGDDTGQNDSDGWADNVAYVSRGDDTEETVQEGWMDNSIYAGD